MKYAVILELRGALAAAVAVEWTDAPSPGLPAGTAAGWRPCHPLPDDATRNHPPAPAPLHVG